jgi:hypothetical protein
MYSLCSIIQSVWAPNYRQFEHHCLMHFRKRQLNRHYWCQLTAERKTGKWVVVMWSGLNWLTIGRRFSDKWRVIWTDWGWAECTDIVLWCYGELVKSVFYILRLSVGWKHSRTRLHGVISQKSSHRQENLSFVLQITVGCSGLKHIFSRSDK